MKIAIIGSRGYPASFEGMSGVDIRVEQVAQTLSRHHSVFIFVRSWVYLSPLSKTSQIHRISIFTLKNKYFDTLIYSFIATIHGLFISCDIFMYEASGSSFFSFLPRILNKRVIFTLHSIEAKRSKWNNAAKIILQIHEHIGVCFANQIIVVSPFLKKYISHTYRKDSTFIPLFQTVKKPRNNLLQFPYLKPYKYILYLGRLTQEKRIEWLISAYKKISPKIPLVIAGSNSLELSYEKKLHAMVKKSPYIYMTGFLTREKKLDILAHCELFVLPSELEGLSTALTEAMVFGRKVLVADIGDQSSIVNDSRLLFKSDSYNDFVDKLTALLANKTSTIHYPYIDTLPTKAQFIEQYESLISKCTSDI